EVRFAQDDIEIVNRGPVELAFLDGALAVNRARFVGPDSRLRVRGRASLEDGLGLSVDGDIDLGILARLTDSVAEADGNVTVRLNVTGPLADPELYGQARVSDARFRFASLAPVVENLRG